MDIFVSSVILPKYTIWGIIDIYGSSMEYINVRHELGHGPVWYRGFLRGPRYRDWGVSGRD